jgi:hypothetical protein
LSGVGVSEGSPDVCSLSLCQVLLPQLIFCVSYLPEVCIPEGLEVCVMVRQSSLLPLTLCAGHFFPRGLYFLGPPPLGSWRRVEGGGGHFGGSLDGVPQDVCPLIEIVWGGVLAERGPTGGCGGREGL